MKEASELEICNGYSGLLGNALLWEGVKVTNIELESNIIEVAKTIRPQDTFIQADAHQHLLDNVNKYGFHWRSPPCPTHSAMAKATRHDLRQYPDMTLYQEIIYLQHFCKGLWVVENVKPYYESLIKPTAILGRHYFWANFKITSFDSPKQPKGFINKGTVKGSEEMKKWLGINYEGNIYHKGNHCPVQVLRNCVHPELGLHILNCALNKKSNTASKLELFPD